MNDTAISVSGVTRGLPPAYPADIDTGKVESDTGAGTDDLFRAAMGLQSSDAHCSAPVLERQGVPNAD